MLSESLLSVFTGYPKTFFILKQNNNGITGICIDFFGKENQWLFVKFHLIYKPHIFLIYDVSYTKHPVYVKLCYLNGVRVY